MQMERLPSLLAPSQVSLNHSRCVFIAHRKICIRSAVFNKSGSTLIDSLQLDGSAKASGGQLVIHVRDAPDEPELGTQPNIAITTGQIDSVNVEQDGPVRAVIKVCFEHF
jgi:hypothetical protein